MTPDERRAFRAQHILDILGPLAREADGITLSESRLVDIGSACGDLSMAAAHHVKEVVGIERNPRYIAIARDRIRARGIVNVDFIEGDVKSVTGLDADLVLCSDVIEHDPDHAGIVQAIRQNLAREGAYFLSTNNRLWPIEGHYGVPFLSYLPRPAADRMMRFLRKSSTFDIFPLSLRDLESLLAEAHLSHRFVLPTHQHGFVQRIGVPLVRLNPWFWNVANAFQVVGRAE